jgi:hypothetical protein
MSNEDKLYEVDTFLAMCEDFMHGKDGDDVTKCRRLINEVIKELSKLHQPTVSNRRELLIAYELRACKQPVMKKYYDEAVRRVDEYLSN